MAGEAKSFDSGLMQGNLDALAANSYPGRGIVLGISDDGEHAVQAYWVMGRSENSRNRIMVEGDQGDVKTEAHDASKVIDPSLIIYNAMRTADMLHSTHVVSNGDQTDTVISELTRREGRPSVQERFMDALMTRSFEPDEPNFTPRISGITYTPLQGNTQENPGLYRYSVIKRNQTTGSPEHTFGGGNLDEIPEGAGICFHTYEGDAPSKDEPIPSFRGSPYGIQIGGDADEIADTLWNVLDEDNRVALAVKTIDRRTGEIAIKLVNQLTD